MLIRILIFLVINFAALGLGSLLMGSGPGSEWYQNLNKAPWTPPGWVFGAAWTLIMVCFAFYMALGWDKTINRNTFVFLFILQWILNVLWNPVFFRFHLVLPGLVIIVALTLLVGYMFFNYLPQFKILSLLMLPYLIWMLIAASLNGYIFLRN